MRYFRKEIEAMIRKNLFYLLLAFFPCVSCSLIFNTVKVEVPENYQGWCYIIPVKDTAGFPFNRSRKGHYTMNGDGIAYVPAGHIQAGKDLWVKVYRKGKRITRETRYLSRIVSNNTTSGKSYLYVQFLIPADKEKVIPSGDPYWRENDFRKYGLSRFDSLLNAGVIVFK